MKKAPINDEKITDHPHSGTVYLTPKEKVNPMPPDGDSTFNFIKSSPVGDETPNLGGDMFEMPNFKESNMPFVRLKEIDITNYKIFDKYNMNFVNEGQTSRFACFIGPNGCGKSTTLEIIQTLFANYDAYDALRLRNLLGRCVRHVDGDDKSGIYGDSDFCIKAKLESSFGDYEVVLTKRGFKKGHPEKIQHLAMRMCYFTRFDKELNKFQLDRSKWTIFKSLFEAVTGFEIEEEETAFSIGDSRIEKEFVFGFYVHKPNETIHYKECSDGERKIMKSFSSLLNLEYTPPIILIDNVEMHVESGRHLALIQAMKRCFSDSQIITTTHSYHISRNFSHKNQVYDLRLLSCSEVFRKEPWRLQVSDEIKDALVRVKTLQDIKTEELQIMGDALLKQCREDFKEHDKVKFTADVHRFISEVTCLFIKDLINN